MKLEPKAKPVRIRIKSGGEEHFNLESLKQNFSVQDLWESVVGGSLSRWLRRQNESELAKQVEAFCQIEKPSTEDYIKFSSLFFEKEMGGEPNDANTLVKFYKERNLKKNFQYAFPYLLHSLDYQTGKVWYNEYKGTKSTEDWIAFFDAKLPQLQGEEEIECYQFLYKLHCVNNDLAKMEYCQSKVKDSIINLAKKDKCSLDKWLASGNYFYAKLLFEDEITRGLKSNSDWIGVFERCKSQLLPTQQGECFYYLYLLSKACGEETKAKKHLEKSANFGNEKAIKELFKVKHSYPKLTEIFNRYRSNNKRIAFSDLDSIYQDIIKLEKEDVYYSFCRFGINMLSQHLPHSLKSISAYRCQEIKTLVNNSVTCGFSKYKSLASLIGALSFELQCDSVQLFSTYYQETDDESPYKMVFELKRSSQKRIIVSEYGLRCSLKDDSIIEQLIFFLETCGERYSILNQN